MPLRIGYGYDVHRLVEGRRLMLGGVHIPFAKGLDGHSDADVLLHAVCDAILGALALGDIGVHFPDTDSRFKDIASLELVRGVVKLAKEKGYTVGNIDVSLVAEQPKVAAYTVQMRENIARAAGIASDRVSIKATTAEGLGPIGRREGIAAHAVVLMTAAPEAVS
jgi:2-C-methyl-D-erythritol 2,4-cyclodiphosphate synthase